MEASIPKTAGILREFVCYRHPGPRRVWKGGSEQQSMTPDWLLAAVGGVGGGVFQRRVSFEVVFKVTPSTDFNVDNVEIQKIV